MAVQRQTVGAQIVAELRRDILFGRISEGEMLSQEAMCQRYQTSRMPVRDALRQLTHEGFLERLPGNRLRVSKLDQTDLLDMFWIEATVHALATKRATERHREDKAAFDQLLAMQVRMKECARLGDFKEASDINRAFHRMVNRMAESPKLVSTLRSVSLGIHGDFITEVPEWLDRSIEEHEQIIDAMRRGDGDRAGELMFLHTQGSAMKITGNLVGIGNSDGVAAFDGISEALSAVFTNWSDPTVSRELSTSREVES